MHLDSYNELEISIDGLEYQFFSIGPKGRILKAIVFSTTGMPNIFNLAFGNLNPDGSIDDLTVSDNKDRNKILATVASQYISLQQTIQIKQYFLPAVHQKEQDCIGWQSPCIMRH